VGDGERAGQELTGIRQRKPPTLAERLAGANRPVDNARSITAERWQRRIQRGFDTAFTPRQSRSGNLLAPLAVYGLSITGHSA
jgi:hypothetical protein